MLINNLLFEPGGEEKTLAVLRALERNDFDSEEVDGVINQGLDELGVLNLLIVLRSKPVIGFTIINNTLEGVNLIVKGWDI